MKPSQLDIEYCIEHKDWINGLLEKRGGWQEGDWRTYLSHPRTVYLVAPANLNPQGRDGDGVWLPSEGDVLAMLAEAGVRPRLWLSVHGAWEADGYRGRDVLDTYGASATPLVALLDLLRAVEGRG